MTFVCEVHSTVISEKEICIALTAKEKKKNKKHPFLF